VHVRLPVRDTESAMGQLHERALRAFNEATSALLVRLGYMRSARVTIMHMNVAANARTHALPFHYGLQAVNKRGCPSSSLQVSDALIVLRSLCICVPPLAGSCILTFAAIYTCCWWLSQTVTRTGPAPAARAPQLLFQVLNPCHADRLYC
jgi:hypothetical protein